MRYKHATQSDFIRSKSIDKYEKYFINAKFIAKDVIETLRTINEENEAQAKTLERLPYWKKINYQYVPAVCEVNHCTEQVMDTGHLLCADHLSDMCDNMSQRWGER